MMEIATINKEKELSKVCPFKDYFCSREGCAIWNDKDKRCLLWDIAENIKEFILKLK